jgi:hypothetical protein
VSNHPETFECACCLGTFPWHDEKKALADLAIYYPGVAVEDCVMVCDDCHWAILQAPKDG